MNAKPDRDFLRGLGRACGGALIFGLPLLMTMEMWWLGFSARPLRLALFLVLFYPFLVLLSRQAGFERTYGWLDDAVDALVAYGVGFLASLGILAALAIFDRGDSLRDMVGKVSLQAVPASMGALLSRSQMGGPKAETEKRGALRRYLSELFIMATGSLFLAFNIAPTQEMEVISFKMGPWRAILLILATLAFMHAFTYQSGWKHEPRKGKGHGLLFLRFTLAGYLLGALLSLYVLWTLGRTTGHSPYSLIKMAAVMGFPAGIGAVAGRLLL
jgi:putative integral membrane protein (TIGR02587 family)